MTGVNPNIGTATTDEKGQARFTYHGAKTGEDTISAKSWAREATPATKTWVAGEQASITLYPENASHIVGKQAFITATVLDKRGKPVSGAEVDFTARGVNFASGSSITDDKGEARFSYTGETVGTDTITVKTDEVEAKTTKIWVEGTTSLTGPYSLGYVRKSYILGA